MATEIEASFLNINKDKMREKLREVGGELVRHEIVMKREVFDISEHEFARVRDEGNKVTMSYKKVSELTLTGTDEICLEVNDYDNAVAFVKALGKKAKAYQEAMREEWLLDGNEVTIDTWPWIPTYIEIEGPTEESVKAAAAKLGFDFDRDAHFGSVDSVYTLYYDIECEDINQCPEIKFTEVPKWLADKRRDTELWNEVN